MSLVFAYSQEMHVTTCADCGMPFAMSAEFWRRSKEKKLPFYCPRGHSLHWTGQTEVERLRYELERKERQLQAALADEQEQRARVGRVERSKNAIKGQLTRVKKRVGNGVCPCCNRTFQNLHRHMATQHSDYKEGRVTERSLKAVT